MATDLTVGLVDRPGTLARASQALGHAGVNIDGACGYVCGDEGVLHVLVGDRERAKRALIDGGFEVLAQSAVVLVPVENRPGEAAKILRRLADAGVNLDILYTTLDGRLVLGGEDVDAIRRALAPAIEAS
jgi:hypothetical protein